MESMAERAIKEEIRKIDPEIILRDKVLIKESIFHLLKTKEELEDFIDTLEMLSDPKFRRDLKEGLKQYREGKTISGTIDDLRKEIA
jgi:predicted DNA-binding protein YlxM (UPF0122 family)